MQSVSFDGSAGEDEDVAVAVVDAPKEPGGARPSGRQPGRAKKPAAKAKQAEARDADPKAPPPAMSCERCSKAT